MTWNARRLGFIVLPLLLALLLCVTGLGQRFRFQERGSDVWIVITFAAGSACRAYVVK
jgi:hypothetical protein